MSIASVILFSAILLTLVLVKNKPENELDFQFFINTFILWLSTVVLFFVVKALKKKIK